ncbi:hypothetical protein DL93DRAFT_2074966 [Clavulina sp. PMI_390]|nr:hypothetical protein DL93DRAFT_2074966 [Clavulina sp. PMI_390]
MFSRFIATLVVLFSILATIYPVSARITGITAPPTVHPGTPFKVTITTEDFIDQIINYYMVFGIAPQSNTNTALHTPLGTGYDLVTHKESDTGHGSFKVSVTIPSTYNPSTDGSAVNLRAVVFSAVGASWAPVSGLFSTNITVTRHK